MGLPSQAPAKLILWHFFSLGYAKSTMMGGLMEVSEMGAYRQVGGYCEQTVPAFSVAAAHEKQTHQILALASALDGKCLL